MSLPNLIVIAGTNASGKSAVGIELARIFGGEILSADSRQIYRGFDLCCGKVNAEERALVPHHMLDVAEVGDVYSAADYQRDAYRVLDGLTAAGTLPFLVGGTGLYIDAIVKGFHFDGDPPNATLREALSALSLPELRQKVADTGFDLAALNHSEQNNPRRLIRILERENAPPTQNRPRFRTLQLGVTWPRELLHQRIDERLATRLEEGMLDEVKAYLDGGGNPAFLDDLGLEYRFIRQYLSGEFESRDAFCAALSTAIKQFAKRQMTWFRRNPDLLWLDMEGDFLAQAKAEIERFLQDGKTIPQ